MRIVQQAKCHPSVFLRESAEPRPELTLCNMIYTCPHATGRLFHVQISGRTRGVQRKIDFWESQRASLWFLDVVLTETPAGTGRKT